MEYLFHFAQRFMARGWSFSRRAFADRVLNWPAARRRLKLSAADTSRAGRTVLNSIPVTSESPAASPANNENTPPSTAGMTTKVVKGSLWTLAGQVAPLGVSLFATPFVIRLLGAEGYGVLILVSLIPTYLGFADLGMGLASTKFASEAYAAGDAEREARTVRTAAVIALCTSVPVAVLVFLFSGRLVTLFNVPEHLAWEASAALKVASVTFVLNFLNQIFNTPQLTRLRMDLNTFVNSGFRILGIVATPIVIYLGGGILGAVIVLFAAALLTLGGHVYMSGRLLPPLFDISLDRNAIRPLLKFGGAMGLSAVASVLLVNLEKLVLTRLTSVENLAYYSVAFTLAGMTSLFSTAMIQSLIPAFSQLLNSGEETELLFERSIVVNSIVLLPLLVFLAVIAKPFFTIWAGAEFGDASTFPFYVLLFGLGLNIPAIVPYSLLLANGRTKTIARLYWGELVPYLFLTVVLTYYYGTVGAALAWSARLVVDGTAFFLVSRRLLPAGRIKFKHSKTALILGALILVPPALSIGVFENFVFQISIYAVALAAFSTYVWRRVLLGEDRAWFVSRVGGVFGERFSN